MANLLELNNVCKKYKAFELKNISFNIPSGKIVGFIGRNGAGKTTTLKSIMNLISIDCGSISAFGKDFSKNELELKQRIGFALTEINYYPDTSVKILSEVASKFYKNFDKSYYASLIKEFDIDENKKIKQLSSGMKVKYQLLLALSHNAELLILDEPTSGLDPVSRSEIVEIFQDFVSDGNKSVLFSTHIISDLEKCADEIVYIHKGLIKYTGTIDDFINSYAKLMQKSAPSLEDVMIYIERTGQ